MKIILRAEAIYLKHHCLRLNKGALNISLGFSVLKILLHSSIHNSEMNRYLDLLYRYDVR